MPRFPTPDEAAKIAARGVDPKLYVMMDDNKTVAPIASLTGDATKRFLQFGGGLTEAAAGVPAFGARVMDGVDSIFPTPGNVVSSALMRKVADVMKEGARRGQALAPVNDTLGQGLQMAGTVAGKAAPFMVNAPVGLLASAGGAFDQGASQAEAAGKSGLIPGSVNAATDLGMNLTAGPLGKTLLPGVSSALKPVLGRAAGPVVDRFVAEGLAGAGLGAGSDVVNNATARGTYDSNRALTANLGTSALTAGLMQGTLGAITHAGESKAAVKPPVIEAPVMGDLLAGKYSPGPELDAALAAYNKANNQAYTPAHVIANMDPAKTLSDSALRDIITNPPEITQAAYGNQPWLNDLLSLREHNPTPAQMRVAIENPKAAANIRAFLASNAIPGIEEEARLATIEKAKAKAGTTEGQRVAAQNKFADSQAADAQSTMEAELKASVDKTAKEKAALQAERDAFEASKPADVKSPDAPRTVREWKDLERTQAESKLFTPEEWAAHKAELEAVDALEANSPEPVFDTTAQHTPAEWRAYEKSQKANQVITREEYFAQKAGKKGAKSGEPSSTLQLTGDTMPEPAADIAAGVKAVVEGKKPAVLDASKQVLTPNTPAHVGTIVTETPAGNILHKEGTPVPTTASDLGMSGAEKPTGDAVTSAIVVNAKDPITGGIIQGEVVTPAGVTSAIKAAKAVGGVPEITTPLASIAKRASDLEAAQVPPEATHIMRNTDGKIVGYADSRALDKYGVNRVKTLKEMAALNGFTVENHNPQPTTPGVPTNLPKIEIPIADRPPGNGNSKQLKVNPKPEKVPVPVKISHEPPTVNDVHDPLPAQLSQALKHYTDLARTNANADDINAAWKHFADLHDTFDSAGIEDLPELHTFRIQGHGDAELVNLNRLGQEYVELMKVNDAKGAKAKMLELKAYRDEMAKNRLNPPALTSIQAELAKGYKNASATAKPGAADLADAVTIKDPTNPTSAIKGMGASMRAKGKSKPSSSEAGSIINPAPALKAGGKLISSIARGTVERIKGLATPESEYVADRLRRMFTLGDQSHQRMAEQVRKLESGLSNSDRATLTEWHDQRGENKGLAPSKLSPALQVVADKISNVLKDWGMNESVNGPYVQDGAKYRPKTLVDWWTPGGLKPDVIQRLKAGDETLRPALARVLKTRGFTGDEINAEWQKITTEASIVKGQGPEFNPLRKPLAYPMPHEWSADLFDRMHSYAKKSASDMEYYKQIESDPVMATLRGVLDDGRGGQHTAVTTLPDGTPINLDRNTHLRQLTDLALSEAKQVSSPKGDLLTNAAGITNPLAVGPFPTMRDLIVAPFTISHTSGLGNMLKGLPEAFAQYDRLSSEGKVRKGGTFQSDLRHVGGVVGDAVAGRAFRPIDGLKSIVAAFNKANGVEAINRVMSAWSAKAAEAHAQDMYDAKDWKGFEAAGIKNPANQSRQSVIDQFTIHGQQELQGSYNSLDTPNFMLPGTDNPAGKFASLLRWSVGQMNRQYDRVLQPALKGNIRPLLGLVLGGLASQQIVDEFNDKILGHKPRDLSVNEWMKLGNPKPTQYALQRLASANVGGMFTQLLAMTGDAGVRGYAPKNTGIATVGNITDRISQFYDAMKEGQTLDVALPKFIDAIAKDTVSLYRDLSPRNVQPGDRERRLFHAYQEGPSSSQFKANTMSLGNELQKADTKEASYSSALKLLDAAKANPNMQLPTIKNRVEPDLKFYTDWMTKLVGREQAEKLANEQAAYDGPDGLGGYKDLLLKAIRAELGPTAKVVEENGVPVVKMRSR